MFVKERTEQGIENGSGTEFIRGPLPLKFNREAKKGQSLLGKLSFLKEK